ncbi:MULTISPECIES: Der GTPase-activating protein YihI [Aeromonas]|uniref:Der GTPase-activating protein YihI n=1 Tax=Aeromonas taiwanensis TaxID=633417 RepID=A0A5F0KA30_9GAMM|nr:MULTISPECIES: Der GTPase-activating protein YihI [Aeromonas]MBP4042447.1 GTPase-activating protein [Aeromonas sp. SrichE-2G]QXB55788.1 GTPase-activating protein [Aeromonas sp. FDAARGOS 1415]TFF75246.1 GTPase-activating protein [Aeromonas taiwanensis]TFF76395.1 GTPase-activating protein [Aeromonas taiwanensis]TFF79498.1 GTPase-activating protein [Aeromonas taiwanensis]
MSAKQPTRKPTGKRKESDASAQEGRERKRAAKRKGLKAGSRQQVDQATKKGGNKQAKDPRIGSRKPIALVVDEKSSKPQAPKAIKEKKLVMTPEQELASIENDDRLNDLLDRLDAGETLEAAEQAWVDQRVDRYQELMDELGIIDTDEDDDGDFDDIEYEESKAPASEDELWERFNQADYQPEAKPEPKKK